MGCKVPAWAKETDQPCERQGDAACAPNRRRGALLMVKYVDENIVDTREVQWLTEMSCSGVGERGSEPSTASMLADVDRTRCSLSVTMCALYPSLLRETQETFDMEHEMRQGTSLI